MALVHLPTRGRNPLLVTGVPRSGTTWLARQLAGAAGTALTGREPMNPHEGQYALGGAIQAWARLVRPTPAETRALRRAYRGRTPRVYGRYGSRQWAAAWPGTRLVVKDPFAVLSVAAVHRVTGALPVLVYRHPGAVLASYRRMGWSPDVREILAAVPDARDSFPGDPVAHRDRAPADNGPGVNVVDNGPGVNPVDNAPVDNAVDNAVGDGADAAGDGADAAVLAWFWAVLNGVALADLADVPGAVVVSHEELAAGGAEAMARLFVACGLRRPGPGQETSVLAGGDGAGGSVAPRGGRVPKARTNQNGKTLHRLDRPAGEVATAWRSAISPDDLAAMNTLAGPTLAALAERRLDLTSL
jgi:Sulfotransferase family